MAVYYKLRKIETDADVEAVKNMMAAGCEDVIEKGLLVADWEIDWGGDEGHVDTGDFTLPSIGVEDVLDAERGHWFVLPVQVYVHNEERYAREHY